MTYCAQFRYYIFVASTAMPFRMKNKKGRAFYLPSNIHVFPLYLLEYIPFASSRMTSIVCHRENRFFFIFRVNRNRAPLRVHICPAKNDRR
jgi:hypothetical protein